MNKLASPWKCSDEFLAKLVILFGDPEDAWACFNPKEICETVAVLAFFAIGMRFGF